MVNNSIIRLLETATYAWKQSALKRFELNKEDIETALDSLYNACLLRYTNNELKDETEWSQFINKTSEDVRLCLSSIGFYVFSNLSKFKTQWLSEDWQSWRRICRILSEIAFLKETYHSHITDEEFEDIEIEYWEKFLISIGGGGYLPEEFIPFDFPESHWWWWYPDSKPT